MSIELDENAISKFVNNFIHFKTDFNKEHVDFMLGFIDEKYKPLLFVFAKTKEMICYLEDKGVVFDATLSYDKFLEGPEITKDRLCYFESKGLKLNDFLYKLVNYGNFNTSGKDFFIEKATTYKDYFTLLKAFEKEPETFKSLLNKEGFDLKEVLEQIKKDEFKINLKLSENVVNVLLDFYDVNFLIDLCKKDLLPGSVLISLIEEKGEKVDILNELNEKNIPLYMKCDLISMVNKKMLPHLDLSLRDGRNNLISRLILGNDLGNKFLYTMLNQIPDKYINITNNKFSNILDTLNLNEIDKPDAEDNIVDYKKLFIMKFIEKGGNINQVNIDGQIFINRDTKPGFFINLLTDKDYLDIIKKDSHFASALEMVIDKTRKLDEQERNLLKVKLTTLCLDVSFPHLNGIKKSRRI